MSFKNRCAEQNESNAEAGWAESHGRRGKQKWAWLPEQFSPPHAQNETAAANATAVSA
jgi:hypothetical protein